MIKFFRKFRKDFLMKKKTGKPALLVGRYATYAIGEIILVVIGILIALQINDWNQNRLNRKQEQQILLQLKSEYSENLKEIDLKIAMRNGMMDAAYRLISIKAIQLETIPADSIAIDVLATNFTPTFDPVTGTTNELLASGKLYILTNPALKTMLTNWSGQVNRLTEYEQDLRNFSINHFYPYLTENHNLSILFDGLWSADRFNIKNEDKRSAISKIIDDEDLDDYILTVSELCAITNNEADIIRNNIESILKVIDSELNDNI